MEVWCIDRWSVGPRFRGTYEVSPLPLISVYKNMIRCVLVGGGELSVPPARRRMEKVSPGTRVEKFAKPPNFFFGF